MGCGSYANDTWGEPMTTSTRLYPDRDSGNGNTNRSRRIKVSVILPCLNEATSVVSCVLEAFRGLKSAGLEGEVIVVDNGSTDGSAELADAVGAVVVREPVPGYGAAIRAGVVSATGDVCVMADADCTYPLDHLGKLVAPVVAEDADLVIGSRLDGYTHRAIPWLHRAVGTPTLSFLIRRASHGISVADSQSGFRAFRRDQFLALGMRSTGMEFASEMLIRATRSGLRVEEIPIGYRERVGNSKLRTLADGARHFQLILLLAPQLLLVWPGIFLLAIGATVTATAFAFPHGIDVGSLRWQPIFFSSISIVTGSQALLAGIVLAHRSSVVTERVHAQYRFVASPKFASHCFLLGAAIFLLGIGLDAWLFAAWIGHGGGVSNPLAIASLAQSLVITGVITAAFSLVYRLVTSGVWSPAAPRVPAFSIASVPAGPHSG